MECIIVTINDVLVYCMTGLAIIVVSRLVQVFAWDHYRSKNHDANKAN